MSKKKLKSNPFELIRITWGDFKPSCKVHEKTKTRNKRQYIKKIINEGE